ncbi:hypothetical protein ACPF7Z_01815 [Halomonas sp. GXIMD04776]
MDRTEIEMEKIFGAVVYHTHFARAGYVALRFARADQVGMLSGSPLPALVADDALWNCRAFQ